MLWKPRSWQGLAAKDRIFISYRRSDARGYAGRLEDTLKGFFGLGRVFRDVGGINPGEDFKAAIDQTILEAGALIVLIGPNWLVRGESGNPRLHDPGDHVASEIIAALEQKRLIIPVLVDGASMPREEELPDAVKGLARRNAVTISDEGWNADVTRLAKVLAFDVSGSVAERRLNRLKLGVLALLLASMTFTTLMFARASFSVACTVQKDLYPTHIGRGRATADLSWTARAFIAASRCNEAEPSASDQAATGRAVQSTDTLKVFTPSMAAVNFVAITVAVLMLVAASTWVAPARRRFIWAAVGLGALGTLGCFVFYLSTSFASPVGAHTTVYAAGTIIITGMLVLMGLSGFKANESVS
jgi:TIR domain